MGVTQVEDTGKKSAPITKYKNDKDTDRGHKVVGNASSVPSTEAPKIHRAARHNEGTDASPSAGTRTNANNPGKEYIPRHGGSTEVRGYKYPEDSRGHQDAKEDVEAHKRAVTPQIEQHPVAVPKSMRNKKS
jgi:hypothetical protein